MLDMHRQFESLVSDYQKSLTRIAATYELKPELQQELLQEIYLALWRALPSFRGDSQLKTFVYRVAHNQAITHCTKQSSQPVHQPIDLPLVCERSNPQEELQASQNMQVMFNLLHRLSIGERQLLTLSLEGLSYQEMSDVTGLNQNQLGVKLSRAKAKLRELMESHHG